MRASAALRVVNAPPDPAPKELLCVDCVSIELRRRGAGPHRLVEGASLTIAQGEVHAVVGESGSGKTLLARSVLRLLPPAIHATGRILLDGRDLLGLAPEKLRRIRGKSIGMVFQEPMVSLNPSLRIGEQMAEALRIHTGADEAEIRRRSIEMLERIRMREPAQALRAYPHEFSGGMRQRIMLASVMLMKPRLLIADEPTTALDALIQREVLDLMVEITRDLGTAVLLITHDLGLVGSYAGSVTVMQKGRIVEQGDAGQVFAYPKEPYTRALLGALPKARCGDEPAEATPLLQVSDLSVNYPAKGKWPWSRPAPLRAVESVSFEVAAGETLAVVGESGSGKTTLGRALLRLKEPHSGKVLFGGEDVLAARGAELRRLRRDMQIIFQDPASSLDPRMRVGAIVAEGLRHALELDEAARRARLLETLEEIGLGKDFERRFPHELSGGQRQRVSIGRAIIMRPKLIVADEPVSALDVTIQAQILKLLKSLQAAHGFAYVFISHDLGVVEHMADRVVVMYRGRIVEAGPREQVFARPRHSYTRKLLAASPRIAGDLETGYHVLRRELPDEPPHEEPKQP
jgi:peptide/nickel transport system ATP-binding protein